MKAMTVSVLMITYNHSEYIKQAVESILEQKTNFDFELIIANDCSPDNTNDIINNIIATNPNGHKIKYINLPTNIGIMPNFLSALKQCNGRYVALCEGDDYWTNNNKLQIQADFLNQNLDYSICFHSIDIETNGKISEDNITAKVASTTTIIDLSKGNYIHTPSVMYRNNLFPEFPEYFKKAPVGDYFLHMLNARYGKIHFINQTMATYRVHATSYWSSKQQNEREIIWIDFLNNIKENFEPKVQILLENQINKMQTRKKNLLWKIKSFIFTNNH